MDKRDKPLFAELESQLLATEIVNLRSAIEKMTINDTAIVSQSDQLKYQTAALSEAMIELERRLTALEHRKGWPIYLLGQLITTGLGLLVWWWWGGGL